MADLQSTLADPTSADYEVATAQSNLAKEKACLVQATEKVRVKAKALGIDGHRKLDRLINDPFE